MNVYLASRYARREEMQAVAADLQQMGHTVTSRWINGSHELEDHPAPEDRRRLAQEDMLDILDANCLISFTEQPRASGESPGRGGRHVEFGIALGGCTMRLIVVGWRENVFHWLPRVEFFPDWQGAKEAL